MAPVTTKAERILGGADAAFMYVYNGFRLLGTHPYYDEGHFGILKLTQVASRLDQEVHALVDEDCWRASVDGG